MLAIADTSTLVAIAACNGLQWLDILFEKVFVPQAVFQEATVFGKPQTDKLKIYLQTRIAYIEPQDLLITAQGLGKGEIAAMALYKKQQADYLLIDDLRARKIAISYKIKIMGSVGILLLAKKNNLIYFIKPYLNIIQQADIHLSQDLMNHALYLAGELP